MKKRYKAKSIHYKKLRAHILALASFMIVISKPRHISTVRILTKEILRNLKHFK